MVTGGSEGRRIAPAGKNAAPATLRKNPGSPVNAASETTHPRNPIEWWFVHGSFEGARSSLRYFMASIFRYEFPGSGTTGDDGWYVIASILDPVTGRNEVISRGERESIARIFAREEKACTTNLDKDLMACYRKELSSFGPPAPIVLADEKATVKPEPFSFSWQDITFRQEQDSFYLTITDPGTGRPCRFVLSPVSPRYVIEDPGGSGDPAMSYITRPRMILSGTCGDEDISGTAWFDHQWGHTGWFLSRPDGGRIRGWDWIGINGDDGSDWIFLTFHDPEHGTVLARHCILFEEGRQPREFHHFAVKTTRFWESEKTRIRYPVAQELEIPAIAARISITPVTDDQEIPVLGFMRTVWEGAAIATGMIGGRPFSGTARLELQGYGYIFDFQQYIRGHTDRIQTCIESFLPGTLTDKDYQKFVGSPHWVHDLTACNQTIVRPVRDLLSREKKYWRPVFALLLLETLGVRSEKYQLLLSVGPELTHTGTLIIDDIEDDAWARRGDACIHRRYGTDIAINAANTLYFLPSVLYSEHPDLTDSQRLGFYRVYMDSFIRGHFGQGQDIWWTKNLTGENIAAWSRDRLREKILQMYDYKTASFAVAAAEGGCILVHAGPDVRDAVTSFARILGVAFQIIDDIQSFEHYPDPDGTGCEDLYSGKLTYVMVRAMELLSPEDRDRLVTILCSKELRQGPEVLREGCDLVRKSGALRVCREEAESMIELEWERFSQVIPPSEPKTMLRLFCRNLICNPGKN